MVSFNFIPSVPAMLQRFYSITEDFFTLLQKLPSQHQWLTSSLTKFILRRSELSLWKKYKFWSASSGEYGEYGELQASFGIIAQVQDNYRSFTQFWLILCVAMCNPNIQTGSQTLSVRILTGHLTLPTDVIDMNLLDRMNQKVCTARFELLTPDRIDSAVCGRIDTVHSQCSINKCALPLQHFTASCWLDPAGIGRFTNIKQYQFLESCEQKPNALPTKVTQFWG